jgi:hypothetical protein
LECTLSYSLLLYTLVNLPPRSPGFFSRLKEKGALAKDVWGVIGSALSVRDVMLEMEKLQAKGEAAQEELMALEMDVTGKIMLASWRGARFEVVQVLREVCSIRLGSEGIGIHVTPIIGCG